MIAAYIFLIYQRDNGIDGFVHHNRVIAQIVFGYTNWRVVSWSAPVSCHDRSDEFGFGYLRLQRGHEW